ncbi:unnamed protein product, partial [Didymodactylos carnosus]
MISLSDRQTRRAS